MKHSILGGLGRSLGKGAAVAISAVALTTALSAGAAYANTTNADSVENLYLTGATATETAYSIYDADDMSALASYVSAGRSTSGINFTLANDITLPANWSGIGTATSENNIYGTSSVTAASKSFDGKFLGSANTITLSGGSQGVFAFIGIDGDVENLIIDQLSSVTYGVTTDASTDYVGALAGFNRGTVTNVVNNAAVYAQNAYNVGGIVGFNDGYNVGGTTFVKGCLNTASVTGKQKVGGIAGENAASIVLCENDGQIVGTNTSSKNGVGGITGRNGNNNTARETASVIACYNKGAVGSASQKWVGGICGFQNSLSTTKGCLNVGTIARGASCTNAVIGLNENASSGVNYAAQSSTNTGSDTKEIGTTWNNTSDNQSDLRSARDIDVIPSNAIWTFYSSADPTLDRSAVAHPVANTAIGANVTAIDVYLDGQNGNDANGGRNSSEAVKTFDRAVQILNAGGTGSILYVSGTVNVSDSVTLRQNVSVVWTGGSNASMFNVTAGTITLGGGVSVLCNGSTENEATGVTAFNLNGGNLVCQDNTTISGFEYSAKVGSTSTMSINRSNIASVIYLYSGGYLKLPSVLTSSLALALDDSFSVLTKIATNGTDDIASSNLSNISIATSGFTKRQLSNSIYACRTSATTLSAEALLAPLGETSAEKVEIYSFSETYDAGKAVFADPLPEGWKKYQFGEGTATTAWRCDSAAYFSYTYPGNQNYKSVGCCPREGEKDYVILPDKLHFGLNTELKFYLVPQDGVTVHVLLGSDNNDLSTFVEVGSVVTDNLEASDDIWTAVITSQEAVEKTVNLSSYVGDYFVAFEVEESHRVDIANIHITTEPAAPSGPSLSLDGSAAADLEVGKTFTVDLDMASLTAALQGKLSWSDNLKLTGITAGSALAGEDLNFDNVAGDAGFSFTGNEGTEDGAVAVATFECLSAGSASVSLTDAVAGKSTDIAEYEITNPDPLTLYIALRGLKGDLNNNGKVNVVDAQIVLDMANGKYAEGAPLEALLGCWPDQGATLETVTKFADVNADGVTDATDARAIQHYVIAGSWS